MDFLKDVLGEELFTQVAEKLSKSDVKLANLADGGYVNKDKFLAAEKSANELQAQIAERDKQLATLQKSTGDAEALKAQIAELQTANETAVTEYKEKLSKSERDAAKKLAIANARPVNETAAKAIEKLIDDEQIKQGENGYEGITEQITAIIENVPTLVETVQKPKPNGVNPPSSDDGVDETTLTDQQLFDKRLAERNK
jgi:myosin heavy subunit